MSVPSVAPAPRGWGRSPHRVVRDTTVTVIRGGSAGEQRGVQNPLQTQPVLSLPLLATSVGWSCWVAVSQCRVLSTLATLPRQGQLSRGCTLTAFDALSSGAPGTCPSLLHGYHRHDARLPHPRRPAHPWVQHPAAPSMLSDVQRTALPALLPPTPGESQQGTPTGDNLGCGCPEVVWVPKPTGVQVSGVMGSVGDPGEGAGVQPCPRWVSDPRFSLSPTADPGMRHATAPRLLPDVPPHHLQRPLHPAPPPAASAPPPATPHGPPGAVCTSPSPAPTHGELGCGVRPGDMICPMAQQRPPWTLGLLQPPWV